MEKLSETKRAELRLIAEPTLDAMVAAEEKLSRIALRARPVTATQPSRRSKA